MKILYILHQFFPSFGSGTEQYVLALAREGRRRGEDVRVFAAEAAAGSPETPIAVESYLWRGVPVAMARYPASSQADPILADFRHPALGPAFQGVLDAFRPEAAHFFHFRRIGLDRLDEVKSRGIPAVIHLMDFWFLCPNFLLLKPGGLACPGPPGDGLECLECLGSPRPAPAAAGRALAERRDAVRRALFAADLVVSPSRTVAEALAGAGLAPPSLEIHPYGIDWDLLSGLAPLPAPPVTIGFLGTIAQHKGVDLLVQAFRRLPGEHRLRIHGRFGDNPEFDEWLRQLAAGDERIAFLGGFDHDRLGQVLGGMHVLAVPSRWRENTPFVLLEGRAAGLEVVASDLPGLAEALPPDRGRLFRSGEADSLAAALAGAAAAVTARGGRRLPPDPQVPGVPAQVAAFRALYARLGRGRRPRSERP